MSKARQLADLGNVYDDGALSNRNMVINGAMTIDQRHNFASHTVSSGSDFFADRWGFYCDGNAFAQFNATTQVVDDAPDGFDKSMKWTTTSAGSIPSTSEVIFRQPIEGYNISHVNYGNAQAKNLILSFYVKASVAGNYGLQCQFKDNTNTNRYIQRSYTISATNTWERVTVSIPANTDNVMKEKTTGAGLRVNWDLGEGATYSSAASNSWTTTYTNGLTGGVKIADVLNATWQITGVQLEIGDTATPFEHPRSYGDELQRCKRYYQEKSSSANALASGIWYSATQVLAYGKFDTTMRAAPTITVSSSDFAFCYTRGTARATLDSSPCDNISVNETRYNLTVGVSGTQGDGTHVQLNSSEAIYFDAEL